jgi:hypothetical protein
MGSVPSIFISEFDFSLTDSANFEEATFEVFDVDCNLIEQESVSIYLTLLEASNFIAELLSHSGNFLTAIIIMEECYSNMD